jgi:hypothetical protein
MAKFAFVILLRESSNQIGDFFSEIWTFLLGFGLSARDAELGPNASAQTFIRVLGGLRLIL